MSSPHHLADIQQLISHLPAMLYRCRFDRDWTMEFISDGCQALTGYNKHSLLHNTDLSYASLIHAEDRQRIYQAVQEALCNHIPFSYEYRIHAKGGQLKWVWEQGVGFFDGDGNITHLEGFITDITSQKLTQQHLKQQLQDKDKELLINLSLLNEYKKAVDVSAIVTKTDLSGHITYVNDEFCRRSGYSREEVLGRSHNIIRDPHTPSAFFEEMWQTILNKQVWKGVVKNRTKDNRPYYIKSTIVPIVDHTGHIREFISIRNDVTNLIQQEKKIRIQTTDPLTGLPNRQKLLEDLHHDRRHKLAIINVERFKEINEYYGIDVGDRLLVEVALLLQRQLDKHPVRLYKLHGDEFAALAGDALSDGTFRLLIEQLLSRIKSCRFKVENFHLSISALAGVALQKNYFIHAEMALDHARATKQELVCFDDTLGIKQKLAHNVNWTSKLKQAIDDNRITVFAQPIWDNQTNRIHKYECLLRMFDEQGTIITPGQFLTVAKKSRLYHQLTQILIRKAVECFSVRSEPFSINLTLEDMLHPPTVALLKQQLERHPGLGERLILEIVEDEGIENYEEVSQFIERMKYLGCRIAIDDFGTGYSNFDYLMRLNVDFIKIDGSIIKNIDQDGNARIVTELIVRFAQQLNIKTIAEFVHSSQVLETVIEMGVDYSQGYALGQPQPLDQLS